MVMRHKLGSASLNLDQDQSDGSIIESIDMDKRNNANKSRMSRAIDATEERLRTNEETNRTIPDTTSALNAERVSEINKTFPGTKRILPPRKAIVKAERTKRIPSLDTLLRNADKDNTRKRTKDTKSKQRSVSRNASQDTDNNSERSIDTLIAPIDTSNTLEAPDTTPSIFLPEVMESEDILASLKPALIPEISTPIPRTGIENLSAIQLERMLNIKWSHFIPDTHRPFPKQLAALMLADVKEVFFGGAAGGGKSDWLLMEALRYCDLPGFSAIIFRKQLTDLKQAGGLIPRAASWLEAKVSEGLARYAGDEHKWFFKTKWPNTDITGPDATLQWGYIGEANVRDRYLSAEYQMIGFEELASWADPSDYEYMYLRLRKNKCIVHGADDLGNPIYQRGCRYCDTLSQMPLRMRAASNPGPAWIKRRFGIIPDPTQYKNRHEALVAISEGHKVKWIGTNKEKPFIPSYIDDNRALDANDYRASLSNMSEEDRSRFEDGNWEARVNSRFKRRWQQFYHLNVPPELLLSELPFELAQKDINYDINSFSYAFCYRDKAGQTVIGEPIPLRTLSHIFTTVDTAVTTKQGPVDGELGNKRSYAVISTWGITHKNNILWLNMRKFRKEIPDFVDSIVQVNSIWKPSYNKIECNGVGIGVAQYLEAARLPVRKNYRKTDKLENSLPAQILMKNGLFWFPENALWLEEAEDDVFSWTGLPGEEDDIIDTLCDAAPEVALGVAHQISASHVTRARPRAVAISKSISGIPTYGLRY